MPEFVNYNKRDASLPFGCKNLGDVIGTLPHFEADGAPDFDPDKLITTTHSSIGELKEIAARIDRIRRSTAISVEFRIETPDSRLSVSIHYFRYDKPEVEELGGGRVGVPIGSSLERNLQEFLAQHSLPYPDMSVPLPAMFYPGVPVEPLYEIPLSSNTAKSAKLISDLFREVCQLEESSDLCFEQTEQFTLEGRKGRDEV